MPSLKSFKLQLGIILTGLGILLSAVGIPGREFGLLQPATGCISCCCGLCTAHCRKAGAKNFKCFPHETAHACHQDNCVLGQSELQHESPSPKQTNKKITCAMIPTCSPNAWAVKAAGLLQTGGQPELQSSEILPQNR